MVVPVGRIGDTCSHGAIIITGSSTRSADGIPVAKLGDLVLCPIHGVNPIVSVSTTVYTENLPTVHIGATAACGAVVMTGSNDVLTG